MARIRSILKLTVYKMVCKIYRIVKLVATKCFVACALRGGKWCGYGHCKIHAFTVLEFCAGWAGKGMSGFVEEGMGRGKVKGLKDLRRGRRKGAEHFNIVYYNV